MKKNENIRDIFEKKTWIDVPEGSDFPLWNLPYGIVVNPSGQPAAATRVGDTVIDLSVLASAGLLDGSGIPKEAFAGSYLNEMIAYGQPSWKKLRNILHSLLSDEDPRLKNDQQLLKKALIRYTDAPMLLPIRIGDYTDFYSSEDHARNLGKLFRDPANPLLPNWKHLPVGYHGRSSSIMISGTPVYRPKGQTRPKDDEPPVFGPTRQLDFELEVAFVSGRKTELGDSVSTDEAEDSIFGFVLFNDLSARDIQKWEYVPLGPFAGKNFASIISPWIVTLEALEPFRVKGPDQDPEVLPYLSFTGDHHFDITLDVFIRPEDGTETRISQSNYRYMYWNIAQQIAHQTANGCNINIGDLYASGTISGPDPGSVGSLIEATMNGKTPLKLKDGISRIWLEDGDTIIFRGYSEKEGFRIGFGEVSTKILPAKQDETKSNKKNGQYRHILHTN